MPRRYRQQYELSKPMKNDLYRTIVSTGLAIVEFELTVQKMTFLDETLIIVPVDWPVTVVSHPRTSSAFGIRAGRADNFELVSYTEKPGDWALRLTRLKFRRKPYVNWGEAIREFGHWLQDIREAINRIEEDEKTPDLWGELERSKKFVGDQPDPDVENTPFTEAEQADISTQMASIRDYIKSARELTGAQISHIEERLDQAERAGHRLGRKDWLMTFNGAVFSLLLADLVTPETAQHVILMTIHGLGHLFGMGGPLHLPPGGLATAARARRSPTSRRWRAAGRPIRHGV